MVRDELVVSPARFSLGTLLEEVTMYSVVLMMAMTGGGEVTAFHRSCSRGCACSGAYSCGGYVGCSRSYSSGCCTSSCHGCSGRAHYSSGCHGGCHGYSSCCGGVIMGGPRAMGYGPAPATIGVTLPANAQLLVDNQPTTSTTARRMFQTPTLQPGTDYVYTLQANVERDGRTITMQKQVTVRSGQESRG